MEAVVGDWYVEIKGKERHFRVSYANTFDEPVGGLNVILTEDGLTLSSSPQNIWRLPTDFLGSNRANSWIRNRIC